MRYHILLILFFSLAISSEICASIVSVRIPSGSVASFHHEVSPTNSDVEISTIQKREPDQSVSQNLPSQFPNANLTGRLTVTIVRTSSEPEPECAATGMNGPWLNNSPNPISRYCDFYSFKIANVFNEIPQPPD